MPEAIAITPLHILYLAGVIVILAVMIMRKDTPAVCIAFLFLLGAVGLGSISGGIQVVFKAILYAATQFMEVIATIAPLPGAREFLDELRSFTQVIILSDTFEQFAQPLMKKLGWPTLFCNTLEVAPDGAITGFQMRCPQSKLTTVKALQSIGYHTIAAGDSFNDLGMIQASKAGFLFKSTAQIKADHPELPAFEEFPDLLAAIRGAMD